MRPYLIPMTNRWVDLDTIQEICEPIFLDRMGSGGFYIYLKWYHAFRDTHSEHYFPQGAVYGPSGSRPVPKTDDHGNPDQLAVIYNDVFLAFFNAWTKGFSFGDKKSDEPKIGDFEPIGWIQHIQDKPIYFKGDTDPREIHDNGQPCYRVYRKLV